MRPTRSCRCHTDLLGLAPAGVLVPATVRKPPPLGFTVRLSWFVSVAEPALPDLRLAPDHLHRGEGTFLSVVHCQRPSCSLKLTARHTNMNPTVSKQCPLQDCKLESIIHILSHRGGVDRVEELKCEAGIAACSFLRDGMRIGLGTGSTVKYTVIEIGRMISEEGFNLIGVPTSEATRELAESLGIPLSSLEEAAPLDITIDGADEFDPDFQLIKGGGGALTREKRVAGESAAMVVVADDRKQVETLGMFDLPLEVTKDDWQNVVVQLQEICPGEINLRGGEPPYITDNDGYILDCRFGPTISDPASLEAKIRSIDGVVEVGLFVDMCDAVVMATPSGVSTLLKQGGRLD